MSGGVDVGAVETAIPERFTREHLRLIALLAVVVLFEGFDISLTSVVLPYLGAEFGAPADQLGNALSIIAIGSIAAWLLIRLADRFGRRPILLVAALGFSLASLTTVLIGSVLAYTAVQFVARLLLVTQISMAYLMLSETLPPSLRGRANGLLGACGSAGAALPFLLLAPSIASPLGWRLLFVIGGAPLLMMPFLFLYLKETKVWLAESARGAIRKSTLGELRALLEPNLRKPFVAMSLLWFIVNFASAVSSLFFTLYVVQERSWLPGDFARIAPIGLAGAFLGYVAAGLLMDLIGRRWTVTLFMASLGLLTQFCYSATGWWQVAGAFLGLQAMLGVWVAAYTLNSELFPTELRAAANGWCHNLIGRWGVVIAPWLLGALTVRMGAIGPAVTLLGAVAYLAIPLVWLMLPETRGRALGQDR